MKQSVKWLLVVVAVVCAICLSASAYQRILRVLYPMEYQTQVYQYSQEYGVSPQLVFAVIKCESSFRNDAVSPDHAKGLMQLTPDTFRWVQSKLGENLGEEELLDPTVNIRYGCKLLSLHLQEFGNVYTALAAYHAGRGQVNQWLKDETLTDSEGRLQRIPYEDTRWYVERVMKTVERYDSLYKEEFKNGSKGI